MATVSPASISRQPCASTTRAIAASGERIASATVLRDAVRTSSEAATAAVWRPAEGSEYATHCAPVVAADATPTSASRSRSAFVSVGVVFNGEHGGLQIRKCRFDSGRPCIAAPSRAPSRRSVESELASTGWNPGREPETDRRARRERGSTETGASVRVNDAPVVRALRRILGREPRRATRREGTTPRLYADAPVSGSRATRVKRTCALAGRRSGAEDSSQRVL